MTSSFVRAWANPGRHAQPRSFEEVEEVDDDERCAFIDG
jgi:hypothetical protein